MAIIDSEVEGQVIVGTDGVDSLTALHNNVTLIGLDGGDGESTGDELFSALGVDGTIMEGGAGIDFLTGNGTNDTASYTNSPAGVEVDLFVDEFGFGAAFADGYGAVDVLVGIENVTGSAFADTLTGDDLANVLQGGAGDDMLTGNGGNDVFKYSFDFTQGGGGETSTFTEFFAAHGGSVINGEVADGTKQGQFSSLYTQWLESLGLNVLDLGQNSGFGGTPIVEGPNGTFGERESFTWTSGSGKKTVTHERWYSDTWSTGSGGGQDAVTSGDGLDTILDFTSGEDALDFSDITQQQFLDLFNVDSSQDVYGDSNLDTVIKIDGFNDWSVTLVGVSSFNPSTDAVFS